MVASIECRFMAVQTPPIETQDFDVVGVGVGPANLALVTAMLDAREAGARGPRAIFLERAPAFAWHPGALLPGSRVQVPFLKDLATLRNPRSRYSFLNYLFEAGRLEEFVNLRELFPERDEFGAYMQWVAAQAGSLIRYASPVVELRPVAGIDGRLDRIAAVVQAADGSTRTYTGRAVVIAVGRRPAWPAGVGRDEAHRIVHTSSLLAHAESDDWKRDVAPRVLVVGSGQSAIEAACFVLTRWPRAHVELCHRSVALKAMDDNPFVNQSFFGQSVPAFHAMTDAARGRAIDGVSHANFGVAERQLLDELYRRHYAGVRTGAPRVTFLSGHELVRGETDGVVVNVVARCVLSGRAVERTVDRVVLGTGYEDEIPALVETLDPWLQRDGAGRLLADADYRLKTVETMTAAVFLQGTGQQQYGPGEPTLSIRAVRAGVLLAGLKRALAASHPAPLEQEA
jgi:L-ornithine N5-monooxygenase